ncbi:hypothetical protein [Microvirga splendida]|uniref:Uncharacterized protein n=1 Tax=Microvirga splendida TaxID=2795727 RepID=A0ABS0Y7Y9_9HYPH|nr:hypothetical protein [Microvirga splendida]MBJ6128160.1 hypothetical protein [Microvirga splendida]
MTDPHSLPDTELVEHQGYQIRLSPSGLEWLAFVARPKQRPTLILAPDREAALAKAYEWIEGQRTSEKQVL